MKTFVEFISKCYYILEKKCFVESTNTFLVEGRYKQESAFIRLFRQARGSKDWSKAAKLMDDGKTEEALELMRKVADNLKKRISDARNDSSNPLNYGRSNSKEYVKGKTDESEESFYDNLDAVSDAVAHAPLEPKLRKAVTSKVFLGRQLFGTGTDIGKLTQLALDAGIKSQTSTADFRISSPRDSSKGSIGGSLKGGPAQIATAEPGDFRAAIQYAAQVYAANQVPETEKNYEQKRKKIIDTLVSSGNEIADYGESQRVPKSQKADNEALVSKSQSVLSTIYDKYPGFDGLLSKTFASGAHRFQEPGVESNVPGDIPGTASVMVHTPEPGQKGREFAIEPISQMEPVKGRAAQGRGASKPKVGERIQRPGTVRFDVNAPKEGEGTLSKIRAEAQAAQQAVAAAEAEKQSAQNELETNPDGTKTYRQHQAQKKINNPNLNARLTTADQAVQTANTTFADIQARAAQAKEILAAQSQQQKPEVQQQQRTEPVDTKPQQPTTAPSQPQQPQPTQTPPSTQPQQTQTPPPEQQQQQPAPAPEQKPEPKKKKPKPENTETVDQAAQ